MGIVAESPSLQVNTYGFIQPTYRNFLFGKMFYLLVPLPIRPYNHVFTRQNRNAWTACETLSSKNDRF